MGLEEPWDPRQLLCSWVKDSRRDETLKLVSCSQLDLLTEFPALVSVGDNVGKASGGCFFKAPLYCSSLDILADTDFPLLLNFSAPAHVN